MSNRFKTLQDNLFFYAVLGAVLYVIFASYPFLHYPYDAIAHLIAIDEMYQGLDETTTTIQHGRLWWHSFWAWVFHLFEIESQQLFLRAHIIHIVQMILSLFLLYYFSKMMLRNVFYRIDSKSLQWLSFWATVIWLSIFSTYSVHYHQVWSMWYSVNYQITLPLFFYMVALTFSLVFEPKTKQMKIWITLQLAVLSIILVRIHIMEFLYYLMYMSLLCLVYLDKVMVYLKRYYYILIFLGGILASLFMSLDETPKIIHEWQSKSISALYLEILNVGHLVTTQLNREKAVINVLMYVSAFFGLLMLFHSVISAHVKRLVRVRIVLFLGLTSMFILIPLFDSSAGFFALITRQDVVHRFYFGSSLFLWIPLSMYYFFSYFNVFKKYLSLALLTMLVGVGYYSYCCSERHNYYKNIASIQRSFHPKEISFHLDAEEIASIGGWLKRTEAQNAEKKLCYFARADIAFVIKYLYHRDVYWKGRRANPDYKKAYQKALNRGDCKAVLFPIPQTFPDYVPYE